MKANETRLAIGGLMRCCTESLSEHLLKEAGFTGEVKVGTVVQCRHSDDPVHRMKLDEEGVWRWHPPT